jgi:hypothetical protein
MAGCARQQASPTAADIDPNKYYAVLLNNNSVYFGKLEGLGSEFPILHDVYYVQSNVNQETKQVTNVLVKRGKITGERHPRRKPAGFWQPANDADLGGIGESGKRMQSASRNAVSHRNVDSQIGGFLPPAPMP